MKNPFTTSLMVPSPPTAMIIEAPSRIAFLVIYFAWFFPWEKAIFISKSVELFIFCNNDWATCPAFPFPAAGLIITLTYSVFIGLNF